MLTGAVTEVADQDFRATLPRFQGENLQRNLDAVATVQRIAAAHDATAGQVALAWLLGNGDDVVPIPGTKRMRYLEENVGALALTLTAQERAELDALEAVGDRYPEMDWVDRDTPTA
jgi:aryl-alcohol dehydrogenase-like predicted oxidoreductase